MGACKENFLLTEIRLLLLCQAAWASCSGFVGFGFGLPVTLSRATRTGESFVADVRTSLVAPRYLASGATREQMSNLDIQKTSEVPRVKLCIHPGGKLPLG